MSCEGGALQPFPQFPSWRIDLAEFVSLVGPIWHFKIQVLLLFKYDKAKRLGDNRHGKKVCYPRRPQE